MIASRAPERVGGKVPPTRALSAPLTRSTGDCGHSPQSSKQHASVGIPTERQAARRPATLRASALQDAESCTCLRRLCLRSFPLLNRRIVARALPGAMCRRRRSARSRTKRPKARSRTSVPCANAAQSRSAPTAKAAASRWRSRRPERCCGESGRDASESERDRHIACWRQPSCPPGTARPVRSLSMTSS